jgi:hypothetical protein
MRAVNGLARRLEGKGNVVSALLATTPGFEGVVHRLIVRLKGNPAPCARPIFRVDFSGDKSR